MTVLCQTLSSICQMTRGTLSRLPINKNMFRLRRTTSMSMVGFSFRDIFLLVEDVLFGNVIIDENKHRQDKIL